MAFCMRQLHVLSQQPVSRLPSKIATKTNTMPGFFKLSKLVHGHSRCSITRTHCTAHCALGSMKKSSIIHNERKFKQNLGHCISRSINMSHCYKILSSASNIQYLDHNSVVSYSDSTYRTHLYLAQRPHSTAASSLVSNKPERTFQPQIQLDLDLETTLSPQNLDDLRKNLSARGSDFNLEQLLEDYKQWTELNALKTNLETERRDIAKRMATFVKGKVSEQSLTEKEALTRRGKAIKEQMKEIMPSWLKADHRVRTQALQLPTDLHPLTQHAEDQAVEVWKEAVEDPGHTSHVQFAEQCGLLKFSTVGPRAVYLLGKAAELEQALLHRAATCLADKGYTPLASPEMFRPLVVEGCGLTPEEVLSLEAKGETEDYYLKGTSLLSFAAFLTKVTVRQDFLPLTMYSVGRHYRPETDEDLPGLYGPVQSNRVTMFGATQFGEQATEIHDQMVTVTWDLAQRLGLPARKTTVSARRLSPSESLRTEVQVWAPSLQHYVTMGYVSVHGDYASRRLMSKASNGNLLHMVSGVALDTSVALASVLEHSGAQGGNRLLSLLDTLKDNSQGGGQPQL